MQIGIDRVPFSQRLRDYYRRPWKIQVGGKYQNRAIDFDRNDSKFEFASKDET